MDLRSVRWLVFEAMGATTQRPKDAQNTELQRIVFSPTRWGCQRVATLQPLGTSDLPTKMRNGHLRCFALQNDKKRLKLHSTLGIM